MAGQRLISIRIPRLRQMVLMAPALLVLAGCQSIGQDLSPVSASRSNGMETIADPAYYPSENPAQLAVHYFDEGNFGLAERYFQDSVEKSPQNSAAWIGLAASYDRLGRFDLADRAYAAAWNLKGPTAELLNNQGYSYLLRGDISQAREKLRAAARRDPHNKIIANNLRLLEATAQQMDSSAN